jgi:hypothetical protein
MEGGVKSKEIKNINELLKFVEAKEPIFIKFYMEQCGHCVTLKPTWDKMVVEAKKKHAGKKIAIVEVEAAVLTPAFTQTLQKHVSNVKPVQGFPTIGTITYDKNKKAIYKEHEKGREEKALMDAVDGLAKGGAGQGTQGTATQGTATQGTATQGPALQGTATQAGGAKRTRRAKKTKRRY